MGNIVIIGGMAAGCKVASRLSKLLKGHQIIVLEKGSYVSFNSCGLLSLVGGEISDVTDLMKTSYDIVRDEKYFESVKNVKVLKKTEALDINAKKREVKCLDLDSGRKFQLPYDSMVIATGFLPVRPEFPIANSNLVSSFHYPSDAQGFREKVQRGAIGKVVIIGGGIKGCSLAESLVTLWGVDVVLIEREDCLLPLMIDSEISYYIQHSIETGKLRLLLSAVVEKIESDEKGSPVVFLQNGESILADYVFYCVGVKPNTGLARTANISIGSTGGIIVDEKMRTTLENVWAAGGCVEVTNLVTGQGDYFPCSSLSVRMGTVAADSIVGRESTFRGAVRSLSVKLFDKFICVTGLTERLARKTISNVGSVIGCWPDAPEYFRDSKPILAKIVYERPGLRLLGLQLVGSKDLTRYIDLLSELISRRRTLESLLQVELASSSHYSAPDTLLNHLASMAISQELDGVRNIGPMFNPSFKTTFIDVREAHERSGHPFPGCCINIPLSELRARLKDFEVNQAITFVCGMGARGYEAARMFLKHGYRNVSYLGGGILLYGAIHDGRFKSQDQQNSQGDTRYA